jgi:hypothetical protein
MPPTPEIHHRRRLACLPPSLPIYIPSHLPPSLDLPPNSLANPLSPKHKLRLIRPEDARSHRRRDDTPDMGEEVHIRRLIWPEAHRSRDSTQERSKVARRDESLL